MFIKIKTNISYIHLPDYLLTNHYKKNHCKKICKIEFQKIDKVLRSRDEISISLIFTLLRTNNRRFHIVKPFFKIPNKIPV